MYDDEMGLPKDERIREQRRQGIREYLLKVSPEGASANEIAESLGGKYGKQIARLIAHDPEVSDPVWNADRQRYLFFWLGTRESDTLSHQVTH